MRDKTRSSWYNMMRRCYNEKCDAFADYGGRGIVVEEKWHDYQCFLADMGPIPDGMTLDRIDNDGPYSRDNCKWSSRQQQVRNTRINRFVILGGEQMCVSQAAAKLGIKPGTLTNRIKRSGLAGIVDLREARLDYATLSTSECGKRGMSTLKQSGKFVPLWSWRSANAG